MDAGKRKHNESLKKYHARLRGEKLQLKRYLRGSVLWSGQWGTAWKKIIGGIKYLTNGRQKVRV